MTDQELILLVQERSPTLSALKTVLGLRTVSGARDRVWPLIEAGKLDLDSSFDGEIRVVVIDPADSRKELDGWRKDRSWVQRRGKGRRTNGPYEDKQGCKVYFFDESGRAKSRHFVDKDAALQAIAEYESGSDVREGRPNRVDVSGADLVACTRCRLRGHEAGDKERCYQEQSFGLGQWADNQVMTSAIGSSSRKRAAGGAA